VWRALVERNAESPRVEERRKDVAHDVELGGLVTLVLLPDDRVLEHVERLRVELAVEMDRATGVQHVNLALGPHRQKRAAAAAAAHHCTSTTTIAVESRDRWVAGQKQLHSWNPRFAYSLYNFCAATTTINGRLLSSVCNAKALDGVNFLYMTL